MPRLRDSYLWFSLFHTSLTLVDVRELEPRYNDLV
jgi:hypothetical protein